MKKNSIYELLDYIAAIIAVFVCGSLLAISIKVDDKLMVAVSAFGYWYFAIQCLIMIKKGLG